jgi:hypothetical protein
VGAGDRRPDRGGPHFRATLAGAGEHPPQEGLVAAIGLYGDALRLTHGSAGGWEASAPSAG